jgi:hypothetical protein
MSPKETLCLLLNYRPRTRARRNLYLLALPMLLVLAVAPFCQAMVEADLPGNEASTVIDWQINQGSYLIPNSFFGMHINKITTPWPSAAVSTQRLVASEVTWCQIERSAGSYNFKLLDKWIAQAQHNGTSLLYTFICVPQIYSSNPGDRSCDYAVGACDPPRDLNADGTGTDAAFKSFVTAMVNHVGTQIQYWEIWNEPSQKSQWVPTNSALPYNQLIRMAKDAREIIKAANSNALMLTPAPVGYPTGAPSWMNGYLGAGGGAYADIISFHGYLNQYWKMGAYPVAENEVGLVNRIKQIAAQYNQQDKPLWVSEGGWGNVQVTGFTNPRLQTAFLARYILLQQSLGIARGFWYQWDNSRGAGQLWNGPGVENIRQPGVAYKTVADWTIGATISVPCAPQSTDSTIWSCTYTRPGGYQAMAVWNTAGYSRFSVPPQYRRYRGLMGRVWRIGHRVTIGPWPMLLEN